MVRIFLGLYFFISLLDARDNPFFPSKGEQDLPYTSNEKKSIPNLKRASLSLPSTARIIRKVTIEYENLDASISTKSIDLENTVDWHLPVFISQSYTDSKTMESVVSTTNRTAKTKKNAQAGTFKEIAKTKYTRFLVSKKSMKIITSDKLIRNFLLAQPHRIVIDFKRDSSLRSYFKDMKNSVYTKIRIGNHKGYYRVVIELDGYYRYRLQEIENGCLISLQ